MYYLYGKCSEVDEFESIQLRVVSEIQPENTLKTLIQRGLLEEAEVYTTISHSIPCFTFYQFIF